MKTHTIKTPTAELMIIELQIEVINSSYHIQKTPKGILIKDDTGEKFISNKYTLLGKPDEIREEDAAEVVHNPIDSTNLNHYANLVRLFSAIESVIFWDVNPYKDWLSHGEAHDDDLDHMWHEAELRTFDRNRSIIFVKN